MNNELLNNLDKLHTTELGIERIKRNLNINTPDAVEWCRQRVLSAKEITQKGKNWYVCSDNCVITVNAHSYTIITAHKERKGESVMDKTIFKKLRAKPGMTAALRLKRNEPGAVYERPANMKKTTQ
jgi:hypothetical protein